MTIPDSVNLLSFLSIFNIEHIKEVVMKKAAVIGGLFVVLFLGSMVTAQAGTHVSIGIGIGVGPAVPYGYDYYPAYPPYYYSNYYVYPYYYPSYRTYVVPRYYHRDRYRHYDRYDRDRRDFRDGRYNPRSHSNRRR